MSDPALATRAPESDAMEDIPTHDTPTDASSTTANLPPTVTIPSAISSKDSPAQSGPTMGEHCLSDRPVPPSTQSSTGTITTLNGVETYISKPADYPSTPAKLLLLLTSGTGIHSINNQLQADRFASVGYLVVMPDQFNGDAAPNSSNRVTSPSVEKPDQFLPTSTADVTTSPQSPTSLLDRIKLTLADTAKSFVLDMWLARHTPETVLPRLVSVLQAVQDEYADAIAHGGGIYGMGYCFGAKYILILAAEGGIQSHESLQGKGLDFSGLSAALPKLPSLPGVLGGGAKTEATTATEPDPDIEGGSTSTPAPTAPEPTTTDESTPSLPKPTLPPLHAAGLAHPTLVTQRDITNVSASVPLFLQAVKDDPLFPDELLNKARQVWAIGNAESKIEVYEDVPHGFAVVGEYELEGVRREQERAWEGVRGWLGDH